MIDDPAFPYKYGQEEVGMQLRDYFAAKAMQGIITHSFGENMISNVCSKSYEYADAMMEERKTEK